MAPGKSTREKKQKQKTKTFTVNAKKGTAKSDKGLVVRKAKEKTIPKKKLKDQTLKWIENVDENFTALHSELVTKQGDDVNKKVKETTASTKVQRQTNIQSEVTQDQVSSAIVEMEKLL